RDGELHHVVDLLDVEGDARSLGVVAGVGGEGPADDEAMRGLRLEHLTQNPNVSVGSVLVLPGGARLPVRDVLVPTPVLAGELTFRNGLEHLVRCRADVRDVDEGRPAHRSPSSFLFNSRSALSRGRSNFAIQRSKIS